MVMNSGDENQQSCKFSKNIAASAQNASFSCKKWSFALLLLTNPLSYTIGRIISMRVIAIGGLLSLTIWPQRVIIMVISMILDDGNLKFQKSAAQNRKTKSVVFDPPWETPSFLLLWTLYAISFHSNNTNLLYYIKEDYREKESWKKSQIW
jgi:hypothetical protein